MKIDREFSKRPVIMLILEKKMVITDNKKPIKMDAIKNIDNTNKLKNIKKKQ